MSQNPQSPFSFWTEMNKQMFDTWGSWATSAAQHVEHAVSEKGDENANPANVYFDFFTRAFKRNPFFPQVSGDDIIDSMGQLHRQWNENLKNMSSLIPNKPIRDTFSRFVDSFQLFSGLQSYWELILKNMPSDMTNWDAFTKFIMKNYKDFSESVAMFMMPDQLKSMFTTPLENLSSIQHTLIYFFKPWLEDASELQDYLFRAMQGDREAYSDFLKAWSEVYKDSFSKLLDMPAVGVNRATTEKIMKLLDYYVNFVITLNEFTVIISAMTSDAMEKLLGHLAELKAEGNQPQTFMEFYKLWSQFNEQAFSDMYATEEFAKIMNETVSAGSKLQMLSDDYMQDILSFLPFPNRRELDDVEQEVYRLRKQVKVQDKELKGLKKLIAEKQ